MRIGIAYLIFETEHKKATCVSGTPLRLLRSRRLGGAKVVRRLWARNRR